MISTAPEFPTRLVPITDIGFFQEGTDAQSAGSDCAFSRNAHTQTVNASTFRSVEEN